MENTSAVDETSRSLPRGGGAVRSIGDAFQPNLAMGGGSYRVPFDLPLGPGGFSPKIDLIYNTGYGNGPFGLGWMISTPFIERKRKSSFSPPGEVEYSVAGAEALVPLGDGRFTPFVQPGIQTFAFDGAHWSSVGSNLVEMRFGSSEASRVAGTADGIERVHRWLLDRITFPGQRHVDIDYDADGRQRYLRRIRWSVFRLELEYEPRVDPFSQFDSGFELRTTRRCRRIALHQDRLAPETLMRTYSLDYQPADKVGASLLRRILVSGWRFDDGELRETALPPLTFGYTTFDPGAKRIQKFESRSVAPPALSEDVTLLDFRGSSLPGVLRMDGHEPMYWENRGRLSWGPPEPLRGLPQGVRLGQDSVRFADLTGNGTADLIVSTADGDSYFPNDPDHGILARRRALLAPDFGLGEEGSWLLDIDGDRIADLLTFRNGVPMAFFNEGGESWSGPAVLPSGGLPNFTQQQPRLRFADMNGDGTVDMVLLQSRQVVYWPYLGNGRWDAPRTMGGTPEFDLPQPDDEAHLADVDGDGTADLILVGGGTVRIYLNSRGESFSEPIELQRTPRFGPGQFIVTDMTGSGTAGFLWTNEAGAATPHGYWFLDLLNGVKPYLLGSIDNGCGLTTRLEYGTSAVERAFDLEAGRRWTGYLPFVVHVVKRMTNADAVSGQEAATEFRYHDGHYDGRAREYLGFGCVDSVRPATANEAAVHQRFYFHNRGTTADDPAFIAGKGQPHRTELVDALTGEVRQVEEATWDARLVPGATLDRPAYLALEIARTSRRLQDGAVYEQERFEFEHDAIGNVIREGRRGEWTDSGGTPHADELIIRTWYASHAVHGLTSFPSRVRKAGADGRLLSSSDTFYDGPGFVGLPFGLLENGWKTRQTGIALTSADVTEAYGEPAPPLLPSLYRQEIDSEHGPVFVSDTQRCRLDAFGNQLETLTALGHRMTIAYDPDSIHPVAVSEGDEPPRSLSFDPIVQQVARLEDANGHAIETVYDPLGNVIAVYRRGAQPGRPTETFEYRRSAVPNAVVKRVRINPDDDEPGWVSFEYRDGSGHVCQVRTSTENAEWAVAKQEITSLLSGRVVRERDAYLSATPDFEAVPPPDEAERAVFYDFAGREVKQQLFGGGITRHHYVGNETRFYGPDDSAAFEVDPGAAPTRISRADAWGNSVSIEEIDEGARYEQRRSYDALRHLRRIVDPMGHLALEATFDRLGNRIRVFSAEAGVTTVVFDAGGNEVLRTDADGRSVYFERDVRGRLAAVRIGGPDGAVEETYTYDAGDGENLRGRLVTVSGAFGSAAYSYSMDGDPIRIRRGFPTNPTSFEVRFGYNNQRQVTFAEYPDGARIDYRYHPNGLLAAIPGFVEAVEYDAAGRRTRVLFANGLETRLGYTRGDRLLQEIVTRPAGGGPAYQHLVHHLDAVGQVVRIDDLSSVPGKVRNNQTFGYDRRTRLSRATGSAGDGYDFEYRYDALGNPVFSGEAFAEDMDYGHHVGDASHPNRLVKRRASATAEYQYDASGNLTHDPEVGTLVYDARHRLVRVEKGDGSVVDYRYDHDNRRVETRVTRAGETTVRYEIESLFLVEAGVSTRAVFDGERRLALVPQSGDALLLHRDRLGNVNVVSNLQTGAFVGNDEYTPFGTLSVSMIVMPHFTFQGCRLGDELDAVLLGARYYRPRLGRFLSPDRFLAVNQEKVSGLLAAANLYLYALDNPANFTDPTGQIAFVAVILIAAAVGAAVGAVGAGLNGVRTWDEFVLWVIGGLVGAVLVTLLGGLLALAFGGSAAAGAAAALGVWVVASLLGPFLTPALDESDSPVAWAFSFLLKWAQSPVLTTLALHVVVGFACAWNKLDLRRGMLFVETGLDGGTLTLGAIAYTATTSDGRQNFSRSGRVRDDLARHEAVHSRTVACMGELGFYLTYVTFGNAWGTEQGGAWKDLNAAGCGNPFEKTAHTFTRDPATPVSASDCT